MATTKKCQCCAAHNVDTPASRIVDAAEAVARGFDWTIKDAMAAGYSTAEPMCEECIAQLPVPPKT